MATTHTDYELNVISPSELKDYMTLEEMHERLVKSINDAFAKREKNMRVVIKGRVFSYHSELLFGCNRKSILR